VRFLILIQMWRYNIQILPRRLDKPSLNILADSIVECQRKIYASLRETAIVSFIFVA
jgi:hypothetical protein